MINRASHEEGEESNRNHQNKARYSRKTKEVREDPPHVLVSATTWPTILPAECNKYRIGVKLPQSPDLTRKHICSRVQVRCF